MHTFSLFRELKHFQTHTERTTILICCIFKNIDIFIMRVSGIQHGPLQNQNPTSNTRCCFNISPSETNCILLWRLEDKSQSRRAGVSTERHVKKLLIVFALFHLSGLFRWPLVFPTPAGRVLSSTCSSSFCTAVLSVPWLTMSAATPGRHTARWGPHWSRLRSESHSLITLLAAVCEQLDGLFHGDSAASTLTLLDLYLQNNTSL